MFAALSVGEVGAVILVDGEAEAAFEAADVVFEEVGVLVCVGVQDGLVGAAAVGVCGCGGEVPRSIVSSASFRSLSRRSAFVAEWDATPPPPNFEPARFWMSVSWGGFGECAAVVAHLVVHVG